MDQGPSNIIGRRHSYEISWDHTNFTDCSTSLIANDGSWYCVPFDSNPGSLSAQTTYYFAGTYDAAGTMEAFLDGVSVTLDNDPDGSPDHLSDTLKIGRHHTGTTPDDNFFGGWIDEPNPHSIFMEKTLGSRAEY